MIDDSPITKYHKRLTLACSGGPFLDGYLLSIVGVALAGAQHALNLSTSGLGFAGAASLIGLFFGSLIFGPLTDRIGRRVMYTADLVVMILASVGCLLITTGPQLIVLRFILGLAIGADYPIATALLTEWIPKKQRGTLIGVLSTVWLVGAMVAFFVGFVMTVAYGEGSWRWMLASGAVFGVVVLVLRMGVHESPRWLIAKGRADEARDHVSTVIGREVTPEEMRVLSQDDTREHRARFRELLHGTYLKRILFCGLFWTCFATPQFAIFTYGPIILSKLGWGGGGAVATLSEVVLTAGFIVGALPGMRLVETWGRRPLVLWSFALSVVALIPLGLWSGAPGWFMMSFLLIFSVVNGTGNILVNVYPNELFPTRIRASAMGLATAISRIGAAAGTYLVPLSLARIGVGSTMLVAAGITFLGFVISFVWAEETRNRPLSEAAAAEDGAPPAALRQSVGGP